MLAQRDTKATGSETHTSAGTDRTGDFGTSLENQRWFLLGSPQAQLQELAMPVPGRLQVWDSHGKKPTTF